MRFFSAQTESLRQNLTPFTSLAIRSNGRGGGRADQRYYTPKGVLRREPEHDDQAGRFDCRLFLRHAPRNVARGTLEAGLEAGLFVRRFKLRIAQAYCSVDLRVS